MKNLKTVISLAFVLLLASCGGGGGSSSSAPPPLTVASLAGTWYGTLQDAATTPLMHTLSVTVDSVGYISTVKLDNVATGQTGFISQSPTYNNLFSSALSNGTLVGFFADSSASHVGYVDSTGQVGALQKGATALPTTYAATDIGGNWSGYSVNLDINGNVIAKYASSATVDGISGAFSGTDNLSGAFNGTFATWNSAYGRYNGSFSQGTVSGAVHAFLSPDVRFAMSYACPSTAVYFISDCSFTAWNK